MTDSIEPQVAAVLDGQQPAGSRGLPSRVLGRTGERVPILALGGWHIGAIPDDRESIALMHAALDEGISLFDNSWDYHDGRSEELMGRALAMDGRRERVFLMTKNCERDYAGSLRGLEESLRRLRTDHVDLWQFHEVNYPQDPVWIFERGGHRAALEAQKAGKVRYLGFTGHHDPAVHRAMLARDFPWDTAQMPINVLDASFQSFRAEVVPLCLAAGVAVIGMKGLGGSGVSVLKAGVPAVEAYRYALSQPVSTLVVGMTSRDDLAQNLALARDFTPMIPAEQAALVARWRGAAEGGRFEPFKSTGDFDGPHHKRQHGIAV
jgi:aryl-alcohol dehydrogenase-like predicted oxidoreductase